MLERLVSEYGYLAVFLGCVVEGETILILGGFAAYRGYLDLRMVMLVAFVGSFLGDQVIYWLGRRWGTWLLARRPAWRPVAARAERLLARYDTLFILSFRFIYGVRTVAALAIGMGGVRPLRFLALNLVAAAIWSVAVALGGFLFGQAIEQVFAAAERYEVYGFAAILVGGSAVWLVRAWRRRAAARADFRSRSGEPTDGGQAAPERPPKEP